MERHIRDGRTASMFRKKRMLDSYFLASCMVVLCAVAVWVCKMFYIPFCITAPIVWGVIWFGW